MATIALRCRFFVHKGQKGHIFLFSLTYIIELILINLYYFINIYSFKFFEKVKPEYNKSWKKLNYT